MEFPQPSTGNRPILATFACAGFLALAAAAPARLMAQEAEAAAPIVASPGDVAEVEAVLDAFHQAASDADGSTYFGLFHPEGVFLGTDATERWSVEEFRAYAEPYFSAGRGWTYVPVERHVVVSPKGEVAWFDERLMNDGLGQTRGSGVLLLVDGEWKVAQYNLTIPVPNALAGEFVDRIRQLDGEAGRDRPD